MDELQPELNNQPTIPQEIPQEPVQKLVTIGNKKPILSIIFGLYFIFIFTLGLIFATDPNFRDLIWSNTILALLIAAPMFFAVAFNIIPLMIFLGIIIVRIKHIREKTENLNWSLWAIALNAIAFAILFIIILSTGKCVPGFPCF